MSGSAYIALVLQAPTAQKTVSVNAQTSLMMKAAPILTFRMRHTELPIRLLMLAIIRQRLSNFEATANSLTERDSRPAPRRKRLLRRTAHLFDSGSNASTPGGHMLTVGRMPAQ